MDRVFAFIVFFSPVLVPFIIIAWQKAKYKKTAYYQVAKYPYSSIRRDKGKYGEYMIYKRLKDFERRGGRFLFNLYVPKSNNETSEIDVLLICSKGLFVFESKNFSGWIFGNEADKMWTQTFPIGRGKSRKDQFYNPILQNSYHIKHLKRHIGASVPIRSVVVFSDDCTLKNVTVHSKDVSVIQRKKVASVVSQICGELPTDCLTQSEISNIYNKLHPFSQASRTVRAEHVWNIQKYITR